MPVVSNWVVLPRGQYAIGRAAMRNQIRNVVLDNDLSLRNTDGN